MSTKRLTRRQKRQQELEVENILNKKFSMKRVTPITENQRLFDQAYRNGFNICAVGSAGAGKTYLGMALAIEDVLEQDHFERIVIIRSAVQSRDQGFMPGSLQEKMGYYEAPYQDIVNDLFGRGDAYQIMKQKGMLQFMSTSFIRGLTFDNAIIVVDEVQNMNYEELRTIVTRIGESSRIVLCGDTKQDDLRNSKNRADSSGLRSFLRVTQDMRSFATINFTVEDIVRSGVVKEFILSEERVLDYA